MAKHNAVVATRTRLRQIGTVVVEVTSQLQAAGLEVAIIDNAKAPNFGVQSPCVPDDTEIVVVLGGDDTILRAVRLIRCTQVPILGVNMEYVGFLAKFKSFQINKAIRRVSIHDYSIGEHMVAHVDVQLPGVTKPIEDWALNSITLECADRNRMVELPIRVDDVEMNSSGADGVIVSTPTGFTTYAFSAGGPVMWPNIKVLQLIPLATRALFAKSLVIGSDSTFTIDILDDSVSKSWTCCDERRRHALPQGTRVTMRESRDTLRLAQLPDVPFTNRLVSESDLPVVGQHEHVCNEASSQSLHHGHTSPAAAYATGAAVAGDAGVAGTEPDKPGERDGRTGS